MVVTDISAQRPHPIDVLIIDDDRDVRETVAQILDDEGYSVASASQGEEAFVQLREGTTPRLILLDLVMPVMDGRNFLARLAEVPRLAAVPVVIVSGSGDLARAAAALQVAGFLEKPIALDDLLGAIRRCLAPVAQATPTG